MKKSCFISLTIVIAEILIIAILMFLRQKDTIRQITEEEELSTVEREETGEASGQESGAADKTEGEKSDPIPDMRVRILNSDYSSAYHPVLIISCNSTFHLRCGRREQIYTGGQTVGINTDHPLFKDGPIEVFAENDEIQIDSIVHREKPCSYRGVLELYACEQGVAVVNQLSLEEYVERVVPSEMPESYGIEAARLQAVCARTYALERIINNKTIDEFGAFADDSSAYQVYNSAGRREVSSMGTSDTSGWVVTWKGHPLVPFYFSTSCGYTADNSVWSDTGEPLGYLKSVNLTDKETINMSDEETFVKFIKDWSVDSCESSMAWFRWRYAVSTEEMDTAVRTRIVQLIQESPERITAEGNDFDTILNSAFIGPETGKRCEGGMVAEVALRFQAGTIKIGGELNIRRIMGSVSRIYSNKSKEGKGVSEGDYLPSAFFCIDPVKDADRITGYIIYGGGNGHGIGLSQNAAYGYLNRGMKWQQVLNIFYRDAELMKVF